MYHPSFDTALKFERAHALMFNGAGHRVRSQMDQQRQRRTDQRQASQSSLARDGHTRSRNGATPYVHQVIDPGLAIL
jgi:hypothetical protein